MKKFASLVPRMVNDVFVLGCLLLVLSPSSPPCHHHSHYLGFLSEAGVGIVVAQAQATASSTTTQQHQPADLFVDQSCQVINVLTSGEVGDNNQQKQQQQLIGSIDLTVHFENLSGTGIWIALYKEQDVIDTNAVASLGNNAVDDNDNPFAQLALLQSPQQLPPPSKRVEWILTCGRKDITCPVIVGGWPTSGTVTLPVRMDLSSSLPSSAAVSDDVVLSRNDEGEDNTDEGFDVHDDMTGRYMLVVSADNGDTSLPPQATTTIELVRDLKDCTLNSVASVSVVSSTSLNVPTPIVAPVSPPTIMMMIPTPTGFVEASEDDSSQQQHQQDSSGPVVAVGDQPQAIVVEDQTAIQTVIDSARNQISILIEQDRENIGLFLRLVFHDCVGGCDGCIDLTNPENNGLSHVMDRLQPIVDQLEDQGLTRTDVWMLSGLVASELALPEDMLHIDFPLHWVGRRTCEMLASEDGTGCGIDFFGNPSACDMRQGGHRHVCHGEAGTKTVQEFFSATFGFNAQQVTAIMGAHSVGKMRREVSGHKDLSWDLSPITLDSGTSVPTDLWIGSKGTKYSH